MAITLAITIVGIEDSKTLTPNSVGSRDRAFPTINAKIGAASIFIESASKESLRFFLTPLKLKLSPRENSITGRTQALTNSKKDSTKGGSLKKLSINPPSNPKKGGKRKIAFKFRPVLAIAIPKEETNKKDPKLS